MKIIGGKFGGLRLNLKLPDGVRPTTDYAKEMIFNILSHNFEFEDSIVLDLFAGTGALGIEALSRGAAHCTFIEKNRKVADLLSNTLDKIKIEKTHYSIQVNDYKKVISKLNSNFNLIFADAPYHLRVSNELLNFFAENCLFTGGLIILEYGNQEQLISNPNFHKIVEKNLGETNITILEKV